MSAFLPTRVFPAVALLVLGLAIAEAAPERPPAKIYEGKIGPYPVAVLLAELPDGNIEGYYFYTKKRPVSLLVLNGARKGETLNLQEYPPSDHPRDEIGLSLGEMSGRFEVNVRGRKVEGKWADRSGGKEHKVALDEIRTEKRRSELRNTILDAYDWLQLASTGCEEETNKELDAHGCEPMQCGLTYDLKTEDVRSVWITLSTTCYGAYPDTDAHSLHLIYETKTLRGILLEEEIAPKRKASFTAYVRREGRKLLDAHRRENEDEDWYYPLGGVDAEPAGSGSTAEAAAARRRFVDQYFAKLDPAEIVSGFHFHTDGVHIDLCPPWPYFPHAIQALASCEDLIMSHQQIAKYLKPGSILRKLSK